MDELARLLEIKRKVLEEMDRRRPRFGQHYDAAFPGVRDVVIEGLAASEREKLLLRRVLGAKSRTFAYSWHVTATRQLGVERTSALMHQIAMRVISLRDRLLGHEAMLPRGRVRGLSEAIETHEDAVSNPLAVIHSRAVEWREALLKPSFAASFLEKRLPRNQAVQISRFLSQIHCKPLGKR